VQLELELNPRPVAVSPQHTAYFMFAQYRCDVHSVAGASTFRFHLPGVAASIDIEAQPWRNGLTLCSDDAGTADPGNTVYVSPGVAVSTDLTPGD
jgi:hypothetical protein